MPKSTQTYTFYQVTESVPEEERVTCERNIMVYDNLADAETLLACLNSLNEVNGDVFFIKHIA